MIGCSFIPLLMSSAVATRQPKEEVAMTTMAKRAKAGSLTSCIARVLEGVVFGDSEGVKCTLTNCKSPAPYTPSRILSNAKSGDASTSVTLH